MFVYKLVQQCGPDFGREAYGIQKICHTTVDFNVLLRLISLWPPAPSFVMLSAAEAEVFAVCREKEGELIFII